MLVRFLRTLRLLLASDGTARHLTADHPLLCLSCSPPAPCPARSKQNPRVLLMLRFVADVMDAVSIITSATSATEEKAAAAAEGAAASGAPATAAAVAGGVRASQAGAAAAAVTEAVVGDAAAGVGQAAATAAEPVAAAAGKGGVAGAAPAAAAAPVSLEPQLPPLEIMVQLSNVGVVLPTSSDSTSALGASIDHLLVAMPGGCCSNLRASPPRASPPRAHIIGGAGWLAMHPS